MKPQAQPKPTPQAQPKPRPLAHPRSTPQVLAQLRSLRTQRPRAFLATIVLAALFVVFVAVAVTLALLHQPAGHPTAPAASSSATSSASTVARADLARMRTATNFADAETTAARTKLHSLDGIPTLVGVQAVINPYVYSLQRYQAVLARTTAPEAARPAAAKVRALVNRETQFLDTINGLPPLKLGTYLDRFGQDITQLQKTLATLQHQLRAAHR